MTVLHVMLIALAGAALFVAALYALHKEAARAQLEALDADVLSNGAQDQNDD
jgi:hypothetical protein